MPGFADDGDERSWAGKRVVRRGASVRAAARNTLEVSAALRAQAETLRRTYLGEVARAARSVQVRLPRRP